MAGAKVFRGVATGRFYYAPNTVQHPSGLMVVRGKKVDITEDLQPYLMKRYRLDRTPPKPRKSRRKGCDVCSRTDKHTHCPECGSTEHVAADCDMED